MRVRFLGNPFSPALLLLFLLFFPLPASADVVDQVHFFPHHAGWGQSFTAGGYLAQTYTAGITGNLTGVNVHVLPWQSIYPLQVSIHAVIQASGTPTWTVLGTTTLAPGQPSSGQDTFIPIPGAVAQLAGTQYAIVLSYPNTPNVSLAYWSGSWPNHNVYVPGQAYFALGAGGSWGTYHPWADLYFATHVQPVPEPATLLLLATGLAGICLKRRTR